MANFLQRLFQRGAPVHPLPRGGGFRLRIPSNDVDPAPIKSKRQALESYVGWVFAGASIIAEDIRAQDFTLWRKTGAKREDWQSRDDHPLVRILQKPNAFESWGNFIEITDLHLSICGETFWHVIDDGRNPIGLEIIYPHWVDYPIIDGTQLSGWQVTVPGRASVPIPASDMIRIYRPHPLDPFMAASPVEAFAVSHYFDLYLRAYGASLMRNDGGIPAGLVSSDQDLSEDQAESIRERWTQRYRNRRGEVAVLGRGAKYQTIAIPLGDLSFLDVGRFNEKQILSILRVPSFKLGLVEDFNRANSEAAERSYQKSTLKPRLDRYEEALNQEVLPRFLNRAEARQHYLEFSNPVDDDWDSIRKAAKEDLDAGAITVNQYLERVGRDPLPGSEGNVFIIPTNRRVVRSLQAEAERPQPPSGDDDDARALRDENLRLKREALQRKLFNQLRSLFAAAQVEARKVSYEVWTLDADALRALGVEPKDSRLKKRESESAVEYFERLKSRVARALAEELAAQGVKDVES